MILKKVKYSQCEGNDREWTLLDFCPQQINLVVGKNATGKTKTLNSISSLAHLITGNQHTLSDDSYEFTWTTASQEICYSLKCLDDKIISEKLIIDQQTKLERNENGICSIFFEQVKQQIEIQVTAKTLCCVARRDPIQHPWFEFLHEWAQSTLHYRFGSVFGKNIGLMIKPDDDTTPLENVEIDLRKTDRVVELFQKGYSLFGEIFVSNIVSSMKRISYDLVDINIDYSPKLKFHNPADPPPAVLRVKETDLKCFTYQADMSQGMFRALSLIIQLNLSRLLAEPHCIIIDDIGEGLDFDRSTQLIRLLIEKVEHTSIQLIMSTNGRFTMNNVDLKYWSVIQREGNKSRVFNYSNAKEAFEEFMFTGLSNFDFLSSEFYLKPPE
jgi:energy-coupling factor transporter ATP-binding protein EcfA2